MDKGERAIMHMDGDAFFAAVEIAKNPKLRGRPVVVGAERGIASAFSYEAKALGIVRGMPIFQIKKRFPKVIVLPGDYQAYVTYSEKMFDVVRRYTDDVEEYSIDECFADLTGWDRPLKMSYEKIITKIQQEIWEELNVSVSIGLAPTKVLAKVASKHQKPGGITVITKETISDFLKETPIDKIWGIGPSTALSLKKRGVETAADFTAKSKPWIETILSKPYLGIWSELNGIMIHKIDPQPKDTYDSIQKTRTFTQPNTGFTSPSQNQEWLLSQISKNLEGACAKARHYHLCAKRVAVFLKTQQFSYHSQEIKLLSPSNVPEIIMPLIEKEFPKLFESGRKYRATGVTLRELISSKVTQGDLFGSGKREENWRLIHNQIDDLEEKFGPGVVYLASTHQALKHKIKGATDSTDKDRDLLFL